MRTCPSPRDLCILDLCLQLGDLLFVHFLQKGDFVHQAVYALFELGGLRAASSAPFGALPSAGSSASSRLSTSFFVARLQVAQSLLQPRAHS